MTKTFLSAALSCILISLVQAANPTSIKVVVVEGSPVASKETGKTLIQTNADSYIKITGDLKKIDMLVFPEYGLNGKTNSDAIPINKANISSHEDLKYLQKIAVDNNLILVANLLEKDSDDLYSTTIVFDGLNKDATEMLAKYRKININENETNLKAAEEIVSFNHTKFGSFGLMSGDDILYTQPAKKLTDNEVKTIIYTTSMRSIAPFKTAISLHAGFAKELGINLVVASLNDVTNGVSGSGIYQPCKTLQSFITAVSQSSHATGSIDLTPNTDCKKTSKWFPLLKGTDKPLDDLLKYNYDGLKTKTVTENIDDAKKTKLCDGDFCCYFAITSSNWVKNEIYKMAVSGDNQKVCALMHCAEEDKMDTCGSIRNSPSTVFDKITITTTNEYFLMPYIVHQDLTPDGDMKIVKRSKSENETSFGAEKVSNVVVAGLVSGNISGASSIQMGISVFAMCILLKYLF